MKPLDPAHMLEAARLTKAGRITEATALLQRRSQAIQSRSLRPANLRRRASTRCSLVTGFCRARLRPRGKDPRAAVA